MLKNLKGSIQQLSSIDQLVALSDEHDATQRYEQLAEVKARTMYNMVDGDEAAAKAGSAANANAPIRDAA